MKNQFTFVPYQSFAELPFGALRSDVRAKLGNFEEFKKSPFSKNTSDDFGCLHVFYDVNDCMEAIEVFDAFVDCNGIQLSVSNGDDLFEEDDIFENEDNIFEKEAIFKKLIHLGGEPDAKRSGIISLKLGISVYAPYKVESIFFFKEGYYD